jgi:hypothetical protein
MANFLPSWNHAYAATIAQAKEVQSHDEHDPDNLDHVTIRRSVFAHKGKWRRFSEEQERSMEQSANCTEAFSLAVGHSIGCRSTQT